MMARAKRKTQAVVETEKVTGTISRIRFGPTPDTGFTILDVVIDMPDIGQCIYKFVGNTTGIREEDEVEFEGYWHNDPKWGKQFKFTAYDIKMPTSKAGITAYLTSTCYGVGYVKANAIYDTIGENCLQVIQDHGPSALLQVKGITPEMAEEIHKHLTANSVLAELSALICRDGVTPNLAIKIYNAYGQDAVKTVKENPYLITDLIHGVGFKTADKVAYSVGILPNSPHRVEAALEYAIKEAGNDGHCYLRPRDTIPAVKQLCGSGSGIDTADVATASKSLIVKERVIREGDCIYPKHLYEAEVSLAQKMRLMTRRPKVEAPDIDKRIADFEQEINIEYAPEQRAAVKMAVVVPLSIITGGPGTGKSTVINGVINLWKQYNVGKRIYLAAPTGRAAKRITETTGIEGLTVHRLLKYNPGYGGFMHNELNPLEPGLLVVDEFSMADIELSDAKFRAIPKDMQVILVGDVDQLPSVGPGSVLRDSIDSKVIPTTFLEYNYRQAQGSNIAHHAHQIRRGWGIPLYGPDADQKDYYVIPVQDADQAAYFVIEEVKEAVKQGYGIMDFQVLSPMRKGSAGVNNLNMLIRDVVNPETPENKTKSLYRLQDKVMVIKNDYNKMVFNGDIGQVVAAGEQNFGDGPVDGVYINFDGNEVFFPYGDLGIVTLAYASTIHKSQGSEFPLVIMPIVNQHYIMLQRNLIYTGITRAKDRLVLIGQEQAVNRAIKNDTIAERFSRLKERLRGE